MIREILRRGDLRLLQPSIEIYDVKSIDSTLIDDLVETLQEHQGFSLAAPLVDEHFRLFVMDRNISAETVFINPKITKLDYLIRAEESCFLDEPKTKSIRARFNRVEVEALNRKGSYFRVTLTGLAAICVQHEMAHLTAPVT